MTAQETAILNELALTNNLYGLVAKLALKGELDVKEAIFLALEQSYYYNPKCIWSEQLLSELKAYARIHGKPEFLWSSVEEYEKYIDQLVERLENGDADIFEQ